MLKKSLIFGSLVLLLGVLILTGCPTDAGTDEPEGTPGSETVTGGGGGGGSQTNPLPPVKDKMYTAAINTQLSSPGRKIDGLVQLDPGIIIIPAGANVDLAGTLTLANGGTLVITDSTSIKSAAGTITADTAGTVIAPSDVVLTVAKPATRFSLQDGTGSITPAATFAVQGPVTIGTDPTGQGKIEASALASSTLYVVGDLTVSTNVTATKIVATGNITFGTGTIAVATAAVSTTGKLIAGTGNTEITLPAAAHEFGGIDGLTTSTITTGTTGITVTGPVNNGKFATGAIFKGNVTFTGTTVFEGTLTHSDASTSTYTFNGPTTITGALAANTGGLTIAGTGAVGLTAKPTVDTNKVLTISNTGGVTLAAGIDIAVAGGLAVSGAGAKIIVPTGQKIAITGSGTAVFSNTASVTLGGISDWTATKAITIAIDSTTGVNITSTESDAKFASSSTAPKITLAANTALGIGGTVTLELAGTANGIAFNNATSTVVLNPAAKITGTAATTLEAKSGTTDGSGIKLTATDGTNNMFTFTTAGVVTASATAPSSTVTFTVGKSEWASTNADNSAGVDSTVATTAAVGSITAAAGTTVTLAGKT